MEPHRSVSAFAVLLAVLPACMKSEASRESGMTTTTPDTAATASSAQAPRLVRRSHQTMGTFLTITAWTSDEVLATRAFEAAFTEFDRLERMMTVWREDSDISHINSAAGKARASVSKDVLAVITRAVELGEATDGKFDITFGALSGLWKFDHDQDNSIPAPAELKRRLAFVDYRNIEVDAGNQTVFLKKAGAKIHLGGIGKGYAIDRAVEILRGKGLDDFMVQAGGDLYVAGRRGDRPWRVGIRDPRGDRTTYFAFAEVTDATFSTSGDYERYFEKDGRRYHHILDPDTGEPASACRSATVMAPDAMTADALSTGIFILGPEKGLALADSIEGVGAVIVDRDNRVHVSKRLSGKLQRVGDPTP